MRLGYLITAGPADQDREQPLGDYVDCRIYEDLTDAAAALQAALVTYGGADPFSLVTEGLAEVDDPIDHWDRTAAPGAPPHCLEWRSSTRRVWLERLPLIPSSRAQGAAAAEPDRSDAQYGVLEVMGHQSLAGRISEEPRLGTTLIRVDIRTRSGETVTQYVHPQAIYRFTPTDEAAADHWMRTRGAYELPEPLRLAAAPRPSLPPAAEPDFDDEQDPDDGAMR